MSQNNFFAMISRMNHINRWGLMRNTVHESISEHSLQVGVIAHALAVIHNVYFGGDIDVNRVAVYAMFHDAPEILTGDLPTPVKYFSSEIRDAYRIVEEKAQDQLLATLPEEMRPYYVDSIKEGQQEEQYRRLVKGADRICALIKCIEERQMGNTDFQQAENTTRQAIAEMHLQEADYFMEHFIASYTLTVDEQTW